MYKTTCLIRRLSDSFQQIYSKNDIKRYSPLSNEFLNLPSQVLDIIKGDGKNIDLIQLQILQKIDPFPIPDGQLLDIYTDTPTVNGNNKSNDMLSDQDNTTNQYHSDINNTTNEPTNTNPITQTDQITMTSNSDKPDIDHITDSRNKFSPDQTHETDSSKDNTHTDKQHMHNVQDKNTPTDKPNDKQSIETITIDSSDDEDEPDSNDKNMTLRSGKQVHFKD